MQTLQLKILVLTILEDMEVIDACSITQLVCGHCMFIDYSFMLEKKIQIKQNGRC